VVLRLRFDDFTRASRSHTLPRATDRSDAVLHIARLLLDSARPLVRTQGLTMIGVAVANLDDATAVQLSLPFARWERGGAGAGRSLDAALDDVRSRFGAAAVTRAVLLGGDDHIDVPLLPDGPGAAAP